MHDELVLVGGKEYTGHLGIDCSYTKWKVV